MSSARKNTPNSYLMSALKNKFSICKNESSRDFCRNGRMQVGCEPATYGIQVLSLGITSLGTFEIGTPSHPPTLYFPKYTYNALAWSERWLFWTWFGHWPNLWVSTCTFLGVWAAPSRLRSDLPLSEKRNLVVKLNTPERRSKIRLFF